MRALKKCLLTNWLLVVVVSMCLPASTHAQVSRFFGNSSQARQTHSPGAKASEPLQSPSARIQQAQFEQALGDPIVPSPVEEATMPGPAGVTVTPSTEAENIAAPPPPVSTEIPSSDGVATGAMELSPVHNEILGGEIVESGFGQPYDIPLGDVIPQQAAETYSSSDWFRNGNWYSKQEFMMLLRADLPLRHVAVDRSSLSSAPFSPNVTPSLSTKNTDFTFEAGTRLSLGHRLGRDPS